MSAIVARRSAPTDHSGFRERAPKGPQRDAVDLRVIESLTSSMPRKAAARGSGSPWSTRYQRSATRHGAQTAQPFCRWLGFALVAWFAVPTRQSFTMAGGDPDERAAAAGLTSVARNGAAAVAPAFAGAALAAPVVPLGLPFLIAGGLDRIRPDDPGRLPQRAPAGGDHAAWHRGDVTRVEHMPEPAKDRDRPGARCTRNGLDTGRPSCIKPPMPDEAPRGTSARYDSSRLQSDVDILPHPAPAQRPPSTTRISPVTQEASSDARYRTA